MIVKCPNPQCRRAFEYDNLSFDFNTPFAGSTNSDAVCDRCHSPFRVEIRVIPLPDAEDSLKQVNESLKSSLEILERKIAHGCIDMPCRLCDIGGTELNYEQFEQLMDAMEMLVDMPIEKLRSFTPHPQTAEQEKISRGLCLREILSEQFLCLTTGNSLGIRITKVS
jgi:hypothetical protein